MKEVAVVMGSMSDMPTMKDAVDTLKEFAIACDVRIISAHRTPNIMYEFAQNAYESGIKVIIAGASGAAHLPGMIASLTNIPVLGVPVISKALSGLDSLLSIVQMPNLVPVATLAIGGARNAAILAVQILATSNHDLYLKLQDFRKSKAESVIADDQSLDDGF